MAFKKLVSTLSVALSLGVLSFNASALPSIENLSFDWETTETGNSVCGSERIHFTLGDDPANDTEWGYKFTVNGTNRSRMAIIDRTDESSLSYANNIFRMFIKGIPITIEVAAYNDSGIGASQTVSFTMPPCQGPLDGTPYVSAEYILASFSDFADIEPFTPAEFEQTILNATTENDEEISIADYFSIISYGKVEMLQNINSWIVLPKTMSEYCNIQTYKEDYRQLTLGYDCDRSQIREDALNILAQQGITPNADVLNYIINGMGTAGYSGLGRVEMSADYLLDKGQKGDNFFSYAAVAHEMLHSVFDMRHANSFYNCENGQMPTDFLNGSDGTNCDALRYGVSVMGAGTSYNGLSAPQRLRAGVLDASAVIEMDNPTSSNFILSDLDTIDDEKKFVLISNNQLPERYQLFIEYSKDNQRLNFIDVVGETVRSGVRIGVFDTDYTLGSEGKFGTDGEVVYFSELEFANVGETVTIGGLNLELSILNKTDTTVELSLTEIPDCIAVEATLAEHESAGRAYSETVVEGQTCWGSFCYGGTEVTTWYAVGSDEELGTNSSVTVVLHEESEGVWETGVCPGPDLTAPVITLAGDNPMTVYQGSAFTDPGATAEDNIDGDITTDIVVTGYVDTNTIDSYELVYTVSDAAGNEAVATRTVNVVAMPACQEYTDTVANHESAGRAYSVTETTGETCWGSFCYGGTTTTTYYAQGSDESLGTNGSATVTLITSENGYSTGSCPSDPVAPVIESTEVSSISYYNAVITGVASDANNDIDHVTITANEQTFYCEGTTNFTCTLQYNVYDIAEVGEEHNATLTAYDSRDAASNPVVVTLTRPEQQASVPPVVSNVQQTREGTVEVVTVNVTDVDGDLEEVVLFWMDYMGGVGCTNTGGDQYRCELDLSNREYGTTNWAIRALDEAGNVTLSDTFTIVWEEEIETCFTAANSEHVSAGRAELRYSVLVYAAGSGDYLGMSGDTTSLEETSDGVWSKVSSCQ